MIPNEGLEDAADDDEDDVPLVSLQTLEVEEGGRALITARHLDVAVDYAEYGIPDSGVLFHVVEMPQYGRLDVSVWQPGDNIFNLLDLNTDKVHYVNDAAAKTPADRIVMEIELSSSQAHTQLPARLRRRQRFLFRINVRLKSQPPLIALSNPDEAFTLARGTEKRLDAKLFIRLDDSTPPTDVVFTVMPREADDSRGGYLRNDRYPAHSIEEFTLADVADGNIFYVDLGEVAEARMGFKVSRNGEVVSAASSVISLTVHTFELQVYEVNNTGLVLAGGSAALITSYNLTFTTNAGSDQGINIR